jgi:tryptophan halogenase
MKNVTIVGGGSAGWMTASYLSVHNPELNITVIESANIPTVGVGEATTPYLMKFFKDIGIEDESEWMPHCNATYKIGILYQDWDFINSRWWHSFEADENKYSHWNQKRIKEGLDRQDYYTSTMFTGHLGMRESSKFLADKDGNMTIPYYQSKSYNGWPQHWAYNLNADLFGKFLKKHSSSKGVTQVTADIDDVILNAVGEVSYLKDTEGNAHYADLFIDCTGFKKLLISKVEEMPFKSLDPYLSHDKACVIRYDYLDPEKEMIPRTRSKCLSSGWMWQIPLYDKISTGYVYTSGYISDDQAEHEMREEIGFDRCKDAEALKINVVSGYQQKPWSKNVVAIGLSAGFIEPLESTALFAIQIAGIRLNKVLQNKETVDEFNDQFVDNFHDFIDYISIGYYMSHRNDTEYWRSRGKNTQISDRMKTWLEQSEHEIKSPDRKLLFVPSCWISKTIGFNNFPIEDLSKYSEEDIIHAEEQMNEIKNFDFHKLIPQKEYLDRFVYKIK